MEISDGSKTPIETLARVSFSADDSQRTLKPCSEELRSDDCVKALNLQIDSLNGDKDVEGVEKAEFGAGLLKKVEDKLGFESSENEVSKIDCEGVLADLDGYGTSFSVDGNGSELKPVFVEEKADNGEKWTENGEEKGEIEEDKDDSQRTLKPCSEKIHGDACAKALNLETDSLNGAKDIGGVEEAEAGAGLLKQVEDRLGLERSENEVPEIESEGKSVEIDVNLSNREMGKPDKDDKSTKTGEGKGEIEVSIGEEEDYESGEEEEDHGFVVGGFVWGKIKSHPWWPGQIYDPSDASDYAAKVKGKGRLLVAYFGDGSFSWCSPSQLKPFSDHFDEMSTQSSSKSFVNAVEAALDELGRLIEAEFTCKCQKFEQIENATTKTRNSGIKDGVPVPKGNTLKGLIDRIGPLKLVSILRLSATIEPPSTLDLTMLRSFLAAFFRQKGGYVLPVFHEPKCIEGLEDKTRGGFVSNSDLNGPNNHKLNQTRKQRSVAELLGEEVEDPQPEPELEPEPEPKRKKLKLSRERNSATKSSSETKREKKRKQVAFGSGSGSPEPKPKPKPKPEPGSGSGSPVPEPEPKPERKKLKTSRDGNSATKSSSETKREKKRKQVVSASGTGSGSGSPEPKTGFTGSRERKKSKYLSPPYTNPNWRREFEKDPEMGMKNLEDSSPRTKKPGRKRQVKTEEHDNSNVKRTLQGLLRAARDPSCSVDESVGELVSSFRGAVFEGKEETGVEFVKRKLEEMMCMVKECGGEGGDVSEEMKTGLEMGMKELLEKVSKMG